MKKERIKSAIPVYGIAALWLLAGLIFPKALLKLPMLLALAALSAGVYFALSKVFPGREIEVRERVNSGSREIDEMIETARGQMDAIRAAAADIEDSEVKRELERIRTAGENIFATLEKDVSKADQVRKFMNYYLPTAEKLITVYHALMNTEGRGKNIEAAMQSARSSFGMIADAFEKQNDNLFRDKALDIETDIEVLETMMSGDGLIGKGSFDSSEAKKDDEEGIRLTLHS